MELGAEAVAVAVQNNTRECQINRNFFPPSPNQNPNSNPIRLAVAQAPLVYFAAAVGFQFEVETLATCRVQLNCHVVLFGGMFA